MSTKKDKSVKTKAQKSTSKKDKSSTDPRVSIVPEAEVIHDTLVDEPQPLTEEVDQKALTIFEQHGLHVYRQIGCGTYAKVKLGYSDTLRTMVAVKIISKYQAPIDFLENFLPRELEIVRTVRHENIIRFYQSIETNHRVIIVMQYANNGTLLDMIRRENYIAERVSRGIFKQLINAVAYCHGVGVVHRDIKCENLLFDQNYTLKIIDFGFARNKMPLGGEPPFYSKTFCGSYAYASPEILKGIPYEPHSSDIWSCGVVLFAMVCGRIPFDDSSVRQLKKLVESTVAFPKEPKLSNECMAMIQRMLAPLATRASLDDIEKHEWLCSDDVEYLKPEPRISVKSQEGTGEDLDLAGQE